MPKLIPKTVTAKYVPLKTVPKVIKPLIERVADAADREGIYAMDMICFPDFLLRNKLPEVISHTVAAAADQLNRSLINQLLKKYNSSNYGTLGSEDPCHS